MKTKVVKRSPNVKKGNRTPTKGAGGEHETKDVEPGVHGLENKQVDDGDAISGLPSSDTGTIKGAHPKCESMDVTASEGMVETTAAVKLNTAISKNILADDVSEVKMEVDTVNKEDAAQDTLKIEIVLEAKKEDKEEGDEEEGKEEDESEYEDEDEDEDEADGENEELDDENVDANHIKEVDNVATTGNETYADHTLSGMHQSKEIIERRKQKQLEVFVGGLSNEVAETDLRDVFEKVGEVMDIRLVRNPESKKFKGYGFVKYADPLAAKQAVEKLNGAEILGQPCRVSPSEEDDILYLGNINQNWTKEKVLETLGKYGVESVENVVLIGNSHNEECHQGFGFVEFTSHHDAFKAFRRLQKPDVDFGGERSAKVAWAQVLDEPDEAVMSQVKSVFVDGIPSVWDNQKVKELLGKHGEIEDVDLARKKSKPKKTTFGFVKFVSREAALACIEASNDFEVIEGDMKVKLKARLALPIAKKKGMKRGICGGFPILQETGGQVADAISRKKGESKGLVRKRVGKSGANKRKLKKAKTENLAANNNDRRNMDTPVERNSQGGRSSFPAHQVSKHSELRRALPQGNSRKFKRFPWRTEDNVYSRNMGMGVGDLYHTNALGYRAGRPYSNEREGSRYGRVLQGNSRATLAEPEVLSVPYAGTRYARFPYYENSRRVPAEQAQQYAVVQGLASPPNSIVQQAPNYTVYGSSAPPVYASGAYAEAGRGGAYISSLYGSHPYSSQGNLLYSLPPTNLTPYY